MAMSPRKKEAGAGGSSRSVVNLGNGATKKPKKMRGGGDVGGPMKPKKMKDGGGLKDMSGDGKITQRDRIMAARGEKPVKKNMGGKVSKKAGVMKRMRGGPINKKK